MYSVILCRDNDFYLILFIKFKTLYPTAVFEVTLPPAQHAFFTDIYADSDWRGKKLCFEYFFIIMKEIF